MNSTAIQPNTSHICTNCFKSLGVPTKMRIYEFLRGHKSSSVKHIVELIGLSQPTVSYHLHDMQQNGLLRSEKSGKEVLYEINPQCPIYKTQCVLQGINFPRKKAS